MTNSVSFQMEKCVVKMNGEKSGIVACSNPRSLKDQDKIQQIAQLIARNTEVKIGRIYGGTARERAEELMKFYCDHDISNIYDISGGDMANEILPFLDYELIKRSTATFWGYSDLTTVINAIYTKTGKKSILYQIMHLLYNDNQQPSFDFSYQFVQGKRLKGIVLGGNIRCLLKLAGTEYWPDLTDKILFLEARSGKEEQIRTYIAQLHQLHVFDKIKGVLLGTFTQLEKEDDSSLPERLIKMYAGTKLPIAKTKEIGHSIDSKALVIGGELELTEDKEHVII